MNHERPLKGERVVIARAAHQALPWIRAFKEAGAEVNHLPLIEIIAPDDTADLASAAAEIGTFDWLVLTSANAADAFLPHVRQPLPDHLRIAVVGPATARALEARGIHVHHQAKKSQAEGLVEELGGVVRGLRVFVPQADDARPTLVNGLRARGAEVEQRVAYSKRLPPDSREKLTGILSNPRPFWITLTSPRIANHFFDLIEETPKVHFRALSIGPVTSAALRELGIEPVTEADRPTVEAMIAAIVQALLSP